MKATIRIPLKQTSAIPALCIIMLVPLFLRERQNEKMLPYTSGTASPQSKKMQLTSSTSIFKSLYSVLRLRNSLLLILVLFIADFYNINGLYFDNERAYYSTQRVDD